MLWTAGLGALLALLLKDRNMLLPVAAFLAGFDMFLVFAPTGPVQTLMAQAPETFRAVTYRVPTVGSPEPIAFVGPADFIFLGLFFVALHRFGMRTRETLIWVVPALLAYLFVVILFGDATLGPVSLGALPALLPIGLVVLLVNRKEFRLTRSEKAATWAVVALAIGLAGYGLMLAQRQASKTPEPPFEPGSAAPARASEAPAASPAPGQ